MSAGADQAETEFRYKHGGLISEFPERVANLSLISGNFIADIAAVPPLLTPLFYRCYPPLFQPIKASNYIV